MDLQPILDSLIFDDVVIWDNSQQQVDEMTFGRVLGLEWAKHDVVYSQDDDIVHPPENQLRILSEYEPGVLTGCMWREWSDGALRQGIPNGYDDLVFAGSGSVYDKDIPRIATAKYLEHFPFDDFFRLWADTIIGILAPNKQIDLKFLELPEADAEYRMAHLPDAATWKAEAIRRARLVRDGAVVAA